MTNTLSGGVRVAALRGLVRTPDGQPFPGVTVTVRPLGGGATLGIATSGDDGSFALPRLRDGWYQIETCHDGLQSTVMPIQLRDAATPRAIDVVVQLAA